MYNIGFWRGIFCDIENINTSKCISTSCKKLWKFNAVLLCRNVVEFETEIGFFAALFKSLESALYWFIVLYKIRLTIG